MKIEKPIGIGNYVCQTIREYTNAITYYRLFVEETWGNWVQEAGTPKINIVQADVIGEGGTWIDTGISLTKKTNDSLILFYVHQSYNNARPTGIQIRSNKTNGSNGILATIESENIVYETPVYSMVTDNVFVYAKKASGGVNVIRLYNFSI